MATFFPKLTFSVLICIIISSVLTTTKGTWFTSTDQIIDPWIYWGAGSNWRLSYSNGLGDTYYLQRFIVTLPHILWGILIGPYWSVLAVCTSWLILTCYFSISIFHLFCDTRKSVIGSFIFVSLLPIWTVSSYTYTQASTIALSLGATYLFLKIQRCSERVLQRNTSFLLGVILSCLANAYLYSAVLLSFTFFLSLIMSREYNIFKSFRFLQIVSGFLLVQFLLQFIGVLFGSNQAILLSQSYFGFGLATKKNPWNGDGFLDFWFNRAWHENLYMFRLFALISLFLILRHFYNSRKRKHDLLIGSVFQDLILRSLIALWASTIIVTFFYIDPISYSWSASHYFAFVPFLLIKGIQTLSQSSVIFLSLLSALLGLFFFNLEYSSSLLGPNSGRVIEASVVMCLAFLIILNLIFMRSRHTASLKLQPLKAQLPVLGILACLVSVQSSYAIWSLDRNTDPKEAQLFYERLDSKRDFIEQIQQLAPGSIVWHEPESSMPLISTQLYAYRLVSTTAGVPDCNLVRRINIGKDLLVSTLFTENTLKELNENYLNPCDLTAKWASDDEFENDLGLSFFRLLPFSGERDTN